MGCNYPVEQPALVGRPTTCFTGCLRARAVPQGDGAPAWRCQTLHLVCSDYPSGAQGEVVSSMGLCEVLAARETSEKPGASTQSSDEWLLFVFGGDRPYLQL